MDAKGIQQRKQQQQEVLPWEQQLQALTQSVQDLIRQNQELICQLQRHTSRVASIKTSTKLIDEKNVPKRGTMKLIDDLVRRTDSRFTPEVISCPLTSKFPLTQLEETYFDGTEDPLDHLETYKTIMCLYGVPDEIMCRAFPITLKGVAWIWFKKLKPGSIATFAQLSVLFITQFIGALRRGKHFTHLLNVKQRDGETLRSYVTRFNYEFLQVDDVDEEVVVTAFMAALQRGDFLYSVSMKPPATMSEMMTNARKHMNGEDAMQAAESNERKRKNIKRFT